MRIQDPCSTSLYFRQYTHLSSYSFIPALRDLFQTIFSTIQFYVFGNNLFAALLNALLFKIKFFRLSTESSELSGNFSPRFVQAMNIIQICFLKAQWKRSNFIFSACNRNYVAIVKALLFVGYKVHAPIDFTISYPVSNRVSLITPDPHKFYLFFRSHNIDVGFLFDGPLSPFPESPIYKYDVSDFSSAQSTSLKVVNLPCHSRISVDDLNHILSTIYASSHLLQDI